MLQQPVLGSMMLLSSCLRKQLGMLLLSLHLILGVGSMDKTLALEQTQHMLGCEEKTKFYFKRNAQGNLPTSSTVTWESLGILFNFVQEAGIF